ncbi:MAG: nascent polypeptide-associated complex protein [Halodesulfurarchaeum sp.]
MFGGGGMNPRKMEQMMEQMGIDLEELAAAEVVITLEDGTQLVFDDADVTRMDARGQQTYQVVGEPTEREGGGQGAADVDEAAEETDTAEPEGETADIPDDDIELVMTRTGASEAAAREALAEADGDLAAAIDALE